MRKLEVYITKNGREPFTEWFEHQDKVTRGRIISYLERVSLGAAKKNIKPLGNGVFEVKIDYGPGYRVYFGLVGKVIVLLLLGGHKGSQNRDIEQAKMYWREYESK
ncbi:MAG: type II toxin-antitoxin system RelE/ParE family toxin [Oligoflexia bacterium]|nr:type II toxin-antitoxin system RelE/ParE family toxin [Oligoflexia bacterium]